VVCKHLGEDGLMFVTWGGNEAKNVLVQAKLDIGHRTAKVGEIDKFKIKKSYSTLLVNSVLQLERCVVLMFGCAQEFCLGLWLT